jgi:tRNA(adenine34) deaminase
MQESYMRQAIKEAQKSYDSGEVPVGAIIVDATTNKIIAISGNNMEEKHDPTAHAEINAIRKACFELGSYRLNSCDIYVTLEPCPMCAQAISFARIRRLYFGAYDIKGGGVEHGAKIFGAPSCHHKPEIYGGICEKDSASLLQKFFAGKR